MPLTPAVEWVLERIPRIEGNPWVSLFRGKMQRRIYIPDRPLTRDHTIGRVRYSTGGAVGYVITRPAAEHFLTTTKRMVHGDDHALFRFWKVGSTCTTSTRPWSSTAESMTPSSNLTASEPVACATKRTGRY